MRDHQRRDDEIAAITGHASLEEVARYTKAAEQRKLARSAMERLVREQHGIPTSGQPEGLGIDGVQFGKTNQKTTYNVNDLQKGWRPVGNVFNPISSEAYQSSPHTNSLKHSQTAVWRFPTRRV